MISRSLYVLLYMKHVSFNVSMVWSAYWHGISNLAFVPPLPNQQTTWRAALQCLTRAPACFLGSGFWMTFWPTMFSFQKCTSSCLPSSSRHRLQSWPMGLEYVQGACLGKRGTLCFLIPYYCGCSLRFSIPLPLPTGTMSGLLHSLVLHSG